MLNFPYKVTVTNENNSSLVLTNSTEYVLQYSGLEAPAASISQTNLAGFPGGIYQSSKIGTRAITLQIYLIKNIATNRATMYQYFVPGRKVQLKIESPRNISGGMYVEGYVESISCPQFKDSGYQVMQVSILCPDPLLYAVTATSFGHSGAGTYSVTHSGDFEVGGLLTMQNQSATDIQDPYIYNTTNGTEIVFNGTTLSEGDYITIDTRPGHKQVTAYIDGSAVNYLGYLDSSIQWLSFKPGNNSLSAGATSGGANLQIVSATFNAAFGGV